MGRPAGTQMKGKGAPYVKKIRAYAIEHPEVSPTNIQRMLNIPLGRELVREIVLNNCYRDDDYKLPAFRWHQNVDSLYKSTGRYNAKGKHIDYRLEHRTPSIECAHTCPTCGMGYDKAKEAAACCERKERQA